MVMKPDMQNLFQSGPCRTTRCLADNMGEYINRRNYLQNLGFFDDIASPFVDAGNWVKDAAVTVAPTIETVGIAVGQGVVDAAPVVENIAKDAAPFVPVAVAVIAKAAL